MKAIVQERYGSPEVLELREVDEPVAGDDQVVVRVRAASVHADVWHVMRGEPYVLRIMGAGLRKPKDRVPGTDLAGHVESVGANVTRFRPGDEVFGQSLAVNLWRRVRGVRDRSGSQVRAEAGRPHVRTGRGRPHVRIHRGAGCSR